MTKNQHLTNKCFTLKVVGRGAKGDFFGKVQNTICFIKIKDSETISVNDVVDVRIVNATEKCVFAELVNYEYQKS